MQNSYKYYVIDSVAEKIIGSFFAFSDFMAWRILKGFDVNKAKLTWNDIDVLKDPNPISEYESVSELRSLKKNQITRLDLTPVVQDDLLEEKDNG